MLKLSGGKSKKDRISFYTTGNSATAIRKQNGKIAIELGKENLFGNDKDETIAIVAICLGMFGTPSLVKGYICCHYVLHQVFLLT